MSALLGHHRDVHPFITPCAFVDKTDVVTSLVISKTKVAPLKRLTIPTSSFMVPNYYLNSFITLDKHWAYQEFDNITLS